MKHVILEWILSYKMLLEALLANAYFSVQENILCLAYTQAVAHCPFHLFSSPNSTSPASLLTHVCRSR